MLSLRESLQTLFAAACGAACLSCATHAVQDEGPARGGKADDASAVANGPFSSGWDFALVYPDVETLAERDGLLGLTELGLDHVFFNAALGHMMSEIAVGRSDDKPVSPDDPTIINEACLRDPAAWRVNQVRMAPYEMGVPGTPSAYQQWAQGKNSRLDQIIEFRLSLRPYCPANWDPADAQLEDQAMHLVYAVRTSDLALNAEVFESAKQFAELSKTGQRSQAYAQLERHRLALASAPYRAFRKQVLRDWASFAVTARAAAADATHARANSLTHLLATRLLPFMDRLLPGGQASVPSLAHPALAHAQTTTRAALGAEVARYAQPGNLERVALMFTVGSQDPLDDFQVTRWFFSQIRPGRYAKLSSLPRDAERVYGAYSPSELETFVAFAHDQGVDVVRATTAGFYSESRGVTTGPQHVYPRQATLGNGQRVNVKPAVDEVDYVAPVVLDAEAGHDMPKLPTGSILANAMDRFASPEATNATTTPCDRCHNLQNAVREGQANGYRGGKREESAYQFIMIDDNHFSYRSAKEITREQAEANAELAAAQP